MADMLQAQLDLQEARAERDQFKLEVESLRAGMQRTSRVFVCVCVCVFVALLNQNQQVPR